MAGSVDVKVRFLIELAVCEETGRKAACRRGVAMVRENMEEEEGKEISIQRGGGACSSYR